MPKLCFIDLETTGLFEWKNGVVQIAGLIEVDGELKERFNIIVNPFPSDIIEEGALKANGRDRDTLFNNTPPEEAFSILESILSKYVKKTDPKDKYFFLAYNSSFDDKFLRKWFSKCGSNYFGSWFFSPQIDIMGLAGLHLLEQRHLMKDFKLGTVLKQMNIEVDGNLHDGAVDIEATYKLFKKITKPN